jgi:hypothetical protein
MTNAVNLSALGTNTGLALPTWTTATRPASPVNGQTGFNTTLDAVETYSTLSDKWEVVASFTIPGAPTIGTATPTGQTTATVAYTAPANTGAGTSSQTITSYTAVASPGGATGTLSQSGSGTITVTGLTGNTTYTFTVYATNQAGNGPSSAASNSILTYTVPDAPTVGTPATNGSVGQLNVPFTAPGFNGGTAITSYTAVSTPGGITGSVSQSGSGTITVSGLANSTNYTFVVYATNAIGNSANSASSPSVSSPTTPGAPTIGTASAVGANTKNASVPFTAPASDGGATITGYTAVASPGGLTGSSATSPITVTNLTYGSSYTFTVYATNGVGNGTSSAASNSVTIPIPTPTYNTQNFAASGTWTKPAAPNAYTGIDVYFIGGGGGGGSSGNNPGQSGGAGGYGFAGTMDAGQLASTESVIVSGATAGRPPNSGGPTSGGTSGISGKLYCNTTSGTSSGNLVANITVTANKSAAGGAGGNPVVGTPNPGGNSAWGGGGGGGTGNANAVGGTGGTSGALDTSIQGGNGGIGRTYNQPGTAGNAYGGAGSGAYGNGVTGGGGAAGYVRIVTGYY